MTRDSSRRSGTRAGSAPRFAAWGFGALVSLVILHRYSLTILGESTHAASAAVAALLVGFSLGSALGGVGVARSRRPLRWFALSAGISGLYCLAFPLLFSKLGELYLAIAPTIHDGSSSARIVARFAWAFGVLLVPTFFSGVAATALARTLGSRRTGLPTLYAWQAAGAALGAWTTASLLVPNLGLPGTLCFAAIVELGVAAVSLRRSVIAVHDPASGTPERERAESLPAPGSLPPLPWKKIAMVTGGIAVVLGVAFFGTVVSFVLQRPTLVAIACAGILAAAAGARHGLSLRPSFAQFLVTSLAIGYLTISLAVLWAHATDVFSGETLTSTTIVLTSLALGLSIGAFAGVRLVASETRTRTGLGISLIASGCLVWLTLGAWDGIPVWLDRLAALSLTPEVVASARWAFLLPLMLLPAAILGLSVVLNLRCITTGGSKVAARLGLGHASLAIGGVLGALVTLFIFLPRLGSMTSLKWIGALLLVAGGLALYAFSDLSRRRTYAAIAVSAVLWGPLLPVSWNLEEARRSTATSTPNEVLFRSEDATAGLTMVVEQSGTRTLRANGRVVGDSAYDTFVRRRTVTLATLFTAARERALVTPLATGVTPAALLAHGFEEVVGAETRRGVADAARQFFSGVNANVLSASAFRLVREDARSILLKSSERYDVIILENPSGSGGRPTRELYALAASRLRRHGLLVHRIPIDELPLPNLFVALNTVDSAFDHTSLWTHGPWAFVVASNEPLRLDLRSLRSAREPKWVRQALVSGSPLELLSDLVVTADDMNGFLDSLATAAGKPRSQVSTDARPRSVQSARSRTRSFEIETRAWFRKLRSSEPPPFRGEPTARERSLASASFVRGWSDPKALMRLASLWSRDARLSDAAVHWLYDELAPGDAVASLDVGRRIDELRSEMGVIAELVATMNASVDCKRIPRFVSRVDNVRLSVVGASGESLDGTEPRDAVDRNPNPNVGKGWRVRPVGRAAFVDLGFGAPKAIGTVHVVVRPIDGGAAHTRLLGRDRNGVWHPLANDRDSFHCRGVRRYQLSESVPVLTELRVEVEGELPASRIALYELWVEGS